MTTKSKEVYLKSPAELAIMRRGGHLLHRVLHAVVREARVGVTTKELDRTAFRLIREAGARPAFLGMYDFPATLCTSVNDEVVHGIPGNRRLENGDVVSIDCGVLLDGFYVDSAYTVAIGEVAPEVTRLLEVTRASLEAGIAKAVYEGRVGDISQAVQQVVEGAGFSVIENYTGHGVGRALHEEPQVPNEYLRRGPRLSQGMTLAIEPMVTSGGGGTRELPDGWTVVTKSGKYAAHYEHTIAITRSGVEVLTRDPELAFF